MTTEATFHALDAADSLRHFREKFYLPLAPDGQSAIYLCGNSLGCQPKAARDYIAEELDAWARLGVEGHLHAPHPWLPYHEFLTENLASIVGAKPSEVVAMGSLTANLHFLMVSFYRPTPSRFKILIESDAFPSDAYAVESQAKFHGYDPAHAVIRVRPREGEFTVRQADIEAILAEQGEQIALVMLGGVNYYTGQVFDMERIAALAHAKGCTVGYDLAHAVGNLHLHLHDWNVDFAAWCSYKYLNAGPGAVGGIFVHERHHTADLPRFTGWWGHDKVTRFKMRDAFHAIPTAEGWQHSNAPVLSMAALRASLDIFAEAGGMSVLRTKSEALTGYTEQLIRAQQAAGKLTDIRIITPSNATERGCQLSLLTGENGRERFDNLTRNGVIADWREPNVIRIAPVPLYNSFADCFRFVELLEE